MKLTKNTLPDYFEIASPKNSHYTTETNTFDFVDRQSDVLLVTIGDSWTWGADLTPNDDEDFRKTHVFGNLLSTSLNTDWLNLALSGSNNFFIAERAEQLGKIVDQLDYKNIYMVCTFTEVGRSFDSHHDNYIDYIEWFNNNHIDNFLGFLNAECARRIKKVADEHKIKLIVGTNFIDAVGIDANVLLPTPWFRLLGIECLDNVYAGSTGVTRLQATEQFVNDTNSYKQWMIELITKAKCVDKLCQSSKLIKQHPTVDAHRLWADYILENIK